MAITNFNFAYRFLSNFSLAPVVWHGIQFPTVEHAYQSAKAAKPEDRMKFLACRTPSQAKRLGRKIELRSDWEEVKLSIMLNLLRQKFTHHPGLNQMLRDTGDLELIEVNEWGDRYWGVDKMTGVGENHLGKLLMQVREEIRARPIDDK